MKGISKRIITIKKSKSLSTDKYQSVNKSLKSLCTFVELLICWLGWSLRNPGQAVRRVHAEVRACRCAYSAVAGDAQPGAVMDLHPCHDAGHGVHRTGQWGKRCCLLPAKSYVLYNVELNKHLSASVDSRMLIQEIPEYLRCFPPAGGVARRGNCGGPSHGERAAVPGRWMDG